MIIVPAEPAADLKPLIDALSEQDETQPMAVDDGPAPAGHPLLLDIRDDGVDLERYAGNDQRLLIVYTDPQSLERVTQLTDSAFVIVSSAWDVPLAVASINSALGAHRARKDTDDENAELQRGLREAKIEAEDQEIEMIVRSSELGRLRAFKAGVINRLGAPERGYVAQVLRHARDIESHEDAPEGIRGAATALGAAARNIEHIFHSFDYWEQAERALEGRTVLIVSTNAKARKLLSRALAEITGVNAEVCVDWKEAAEILKSQYIDILYIDWDNKELLSDETLRSDVHIVLITNELIFERAGREMLDLPLSNVLITSEASLDDAEESLLLREIAVTAGKLLTGEIFGISKYLAWGTTIHEMKINNSNQRFDVMERIRDFAPRAGLRRSLCQNLETLCDELLMNAIWDAPVDENGNHIYAELSRKTAIELKEHEQPLLRYGADDRLVGVSVTDPFGGLEREHAFKYLIKCFAKREGQIDTKKGGAGLGLYTAFLSVSTFIINVTAGKTTEVIGLLDTALTRRKLSGRSRSYHYFTGRHV